MLGCRLTVDQLEMNLRQQNVQQIGDVEWATLEANGRVALVLKEDVQPVTKKDLKQLTRVLEQKIDHLNQVLNKYEQPKRSQSREKNLKDQTPLFKEIDKEKHVTEPPKYLD